MTTTMKIMSVAVVATIYYSDGGGGDAAPFRQAAATGREKLTDNYET